MKRLILTSSSIKQLMQYAGLCIALFISTSASAGNLHNTPENYSDRLDIRPAVSVSTILDQSFIFYIFPNPSRGGELTLKFEHASLGKMQVKVFNIIGNEVFSQNMEITNTGDFTTSIMLPAGLSSGTYLVKVDANNTTCTKRFILRKAE